MKVSGSVSFIFHSQFLIYRTGLPKRGLSAPAIPGCDDEGTSVRSVRGREAGLWEPGANTDLSLIDKSVFVDQKHITT